MKLSPLTVKWMMNLYPPLFFNRIVVKSVSADFKHIRVVIKKSLLNTNLNRSIFGGTLFSAADPFYAIMYWQILIRKGIRTDAWVRAIEGNYIKPASTRMYIDFILSNEDIAEAEKMIMKEGRLKKWHVAQLKNRFDEVCAEFKVLVYLKLSGKEGKSVF